MGVAAAVGGGTLTAKETVLAADEAMIGLFGLLIYNHLGLMNRRLAEAEAELESLKEPSRENEATPA